MQFVVESGCISRLVQLLDHCDTNIARPSLLAIGNIVRDIDNSLTDIVLNCGLLSHMAKLLNHDRASIVTEAVYILSNIACGEIFILLSHSFQLCINIISNALLKNDRNYRANSTVT